MDTVTAVAPEGRAESNRDRVRRLLIRPLAFRAPARMDASGFGAEQDAVADELAYMRDDSLEALCDMLKTKGGGPDRNRWPDRATIRGFAEVVQPRPVTDMPALVRWFRSVEGPRARADGTLVETLIYFQKHKAPPVTPGARTFIAGQAAGHARRLVIIAERLEAGWPVAPDELEWRRWYLGQRDKADQMVGGADADPS